MTKDVIELAREAGIAMYPLDDDYCDAVGLERGTICRVSDIGIEELNRLAALVAARERERCEKAVENSSSCFTSDQAYIKKLAVAAIRALNTEGDGHG